MSEAAPLWVCFVPQFASVVGDSFGQRCSRVYHGGNRRRFILGLIAVSSLQMFMVLSVIQLALPSTTKVIYTKAGNGSNAMIDYCALPENANDDHCYSQGPLTIYRALDLCPLLLLNGVLNIVYYLGEASMYRQPLGVLMLVLAALASSFIIAPLQEWFELSGAKQVSPWAIVLGIFGSLLCLIERTPPCSSSSSGGATAVDVSRNLHDHASDDSPSATDGPSTASLRLHGLGDDEDGSAAINAAESSPLTAPPSTSSNKNARAPATLCRKIMSLLPLMAPFLLLSFAYALYFVIMLMYNDKCRVNMWGYNAYDQVTLPLYMFGLFFIVDSIAPCRATIRWDEQQEDSMLEACKQCYKELTANRCAGLINMFIYRMLINARAVAYTYITVTYNLSSSYLELTLIRVVLSWVASLALVLAVPAFIKSEAAEQQKLKDWLNLVLKIAGTAAIVGSLLIINQE